MQVLVSRYINIFLFLHLFVSNALTQNRIIIQELNKKEVVANDTVYVIESKLDTLDFELIPNLRNGKWAMLNPDNNSISLLFEIKNGKRDGVFKYFHKSSGILYKYISFKENMGHGLSYLRTIDGKLLNYQYNYFNEIDYKLYGAYNMKGWFCLTTYYRGMPLSKRCKKKYFLFDKTLRKYYQQKSTVVLIKKIN